VLLAYLRPSVNPSVVTAACSLELGRLKTFTEFSVVLVREYIRSSSDIMWGWMWGYKYTKIKFADKSIGYCEIW
jgi:hypothetical protein